MGKEIQRNSNKLEEIHKMLEMYAEGGVWGVWGVWWIISSYTDFVQKFKKRLHHVRTPH